MVVGRGPGVVGVTALRTKRVRDTLGKRKSEKWCFPAGYTTVTV